MTHSEAVERAAQRYRDEGYRVKLRPTAADVPPFADLGMDLYATKDGVHVLVRAVVTTNDLQGDEATARAAKALENRTDGWRLDLVVFNPQNPSHQRVIIDMTGPTVTKRIVEGPIPVSAETAPTPGK